MTSLPAVPSSVIAGRYEIETMLGRGGMGIVYRALDTATGQRVALKRLRPERTQGAQVSRVLFEREYHGLSQLAHPCIIEVYDYGVDDEGPFYTMELLDGEDLRKAPPTDFQSICSVLRDIASSLAVIHSRSLVHRDVSQRNIRWTASGRAKLLDFGAMTSMGIARQIVGTPPCVPPEAAHQQSLDGRADIYSLGVVAYWMLTGRNPYPARSFAQLVDAFRSTPRPPTDFNPDIPPGLGALVMRMIALDPVHRPSCAAELIERLSVIGELSRDAHLGTVGSYLSTPTLVGRAQSVLEVRRRFAPLLHGQGMSVIVEAGSGAGRTRMLDACVLEAKLLGATVIRADAADAVRGDYGVARALAREIFRVFPKEAEHAANLRRAILAPLLDAEVEEEASLLHVERRKLQIALRDWILAAVRGARVLIAIDDFDRIDEPSAALIANLARSSRRTALAIAVSRDADNAPSVPEEVLARYGHRIELSRLSRSDTVELVRSVFGDARHVEAVAHRIHAVCQGVPRDVMQFVRHLVDDGIARYETGGWLLPEDARTIALPESLTAALEARLARLDEDARDLVSALSLDDPTAFAPEHYAGLTGHGDVGRTLQALSSLVTSNILVAEGDVHRFAARSFADHVRRGLTVEAERELHGRLYEVPRRRVDPVTRLRHLLLSGQEREAIEQLIDVIDADSVGYTRDALDLTERAVDRAIELGMPAEARVKLHLRCVGISCQLPDFQVFSRHAPPMLERLLSDSGLSDYYALGDEVPNHERLQQAIMRAHARYQALPESERAFNPFESIKRLARLYAAYTAMAGSASDAELVTSLPSLAPFAAFSPAAAVIQRLVEGEAALERGRYVECRRIFVEIIDRVAEPDGGGLEPQVRDITRHSLLYIVASIDATSGQPSALEMAGQLDDVPYYRINGWVAKKAYYRIQGDVQRARECQQRIEILQLQDGPQPLQSASYRSELNACAMNEDLMGLKGLLPGIDAQARRFPGLSMLRAAMHARYHYLRGDFPRAMEELAPELKKARAGVHADWAAIVTTHVELLLAMGQADEALARVEEYVAAAESEEIERARWALEPYAVKALLAAGHLDAARTRCEVLIAELREQGVPGAPLANVLELRARIASAQDDQQGLVRWMAEHAQHCDRVKSPGLRARHQRLVREVEGRPFETGVWSTGETDSMAESSVTMTIRQRMLEYTDVAERAHVALLVLLENTRRDRGYLFGFRKGRFELLAGVPGAPSEQVIAAMDGLVHGEVTGGDETATLSGSASDQLAEFPPGFDPIMLTLHRDEAVVFVAAAAIESGGDTGVVLDRNLTHVLSQCLVDLASVDPVPCAS